jgi:hypothetical protein
MPALGEYLLLRQRLGSLVYGDEAWTKHVQHDGRIHAPLLHIGQPHYRASTFTPNLHSVPNSKKGSAFGDECRSLFHAPGDWLIVAADQANLQDRALAHYLHDFDSGRLAKAFAEGGDQHWPNAIALGLIAGGTARGKENKLHTALREGAKRFRYAFLFGSGTERLGTIIYDISRSAQRTDPANTLPQQFFGSKSRPTGPALKRIGALSRKRFLDGTPGLEALQSRLWKYVDQQGWIRGLDGRRLPLRSKHTALNYLLVCAEAIICKRWLVQAHDELCTRFRYGWNGDVVLCLWVHDELVACCRPQIAEQVGEIMVRYAKEAGKFYDLKVPLDAEYKIGKSWAGETIDANTTTPQPITQTDRDEINAGLKREGIAPINWDAFVSTNAKSAGCPGSGEPKITNPQPSYAVEPQANHHATVENSDNQGGSSSDSGEATSATGGNGAGNGKWGDYHGGESERRADKPYGPVRAALYARGYRVARTFPFTVPGEVEPRFYEDRFELRPEIKPAKERPHKTSRFWHRADGKKYCDTGPRRIVYNWPAIMAAGPGATVLITEGANKSEPLNKAGLLATAAPYHQWGPECIAALANRHLIYFEDHDLADDGGRIKAKEFSSDAHRNLGPLAASFRIVPALHLWKNLERNGEPPRGWDVKNWLESNGDAAKLLDICQQIPTDGVRNRPAITSEILETMTFKPINYVVPGIIVEGLTLFAGKPKIGKSWLLLHAAIAVAASESTLGDIKCEEGDVLYCALEDNPRRLQSRMRILRPGKPWPPRLHFQTEMLRLSVGGLDYIREWLESVKQPRLVVIDTLAMVRAPKGRDQTQYEADYNAVLTLRALAAERGIAIVVIHHLRKMDSDDAFDTVSGTLGLTGAPDTILVLKRDQSGAIILYGRGRDLVEIEKAMSFDRATCTWTIVGEVQEARRSAAQEKILDAMVAIGEPATPSEIATEARTTANGVKQFLRKLVEAGLVCKPEKGKYALTGITR